MKILWIARNAPLPSQVTELRELFGEDVRIEQSLEPFDGFREVLTRFEKSGCDDMVLQAPFTVFYILLEHNIHPLTCKLQQVAPEEAEFTNKGKHYKHKYIGRVARTDITLENPLARGIRNGSGGNLKEEILNICRKINHGKEKGQAEGGDS